MADEYNPKRFPVVIFEGGIAAGKSTMVTEVAEEIGPQCLSLMEPVPENGTNPFLARFYGDQRRWAFTFQVSQLTPRMELQLMAQYHALSGVGPVLCDRSFYGDTCFVHMLYKAGIMDDMEFVIYERLYQLMTAFVLLPSICIRIMTSPEVQMQRIEKRIKEKPQRACESKIDIGYLRALEEEIGLTVDVLRSRGVYVLDVPYDVDLDDKAARAPLVRNIASHISRWKPKDHFFDVHRRITV